MPYLDRDDCVFGIYDDCFTFVEYAKFLIAAIVFAIEEIANHQYWLQKDSNQVQWRDTKDISLQ